MVYWFWPTLSVERGTVLKEKDNTTHIKINVTTNIRGGGGGGGNM